MSRAPMSAQMVGRLCRAISPREPHWVAVVLFEMYMDETGTHEGAPVVGAAAYLARSEQWEAFTSAWTGVLQLPEFNIKAFHATDYETMHGEFEGWDPPKKKALGECLFPLLPANTWIGIGNAIVTADWEDALKGHDELRAALGPAYLGCFQRIVDRLLMAMRLNPPDDQIAIFCEDNDFKGEISKIWDAWLKPQDTQGRLVSITFGGKKDFVPLQAADALAYESYKALDNRGTGRTRKSADVMNSTGNIGIFYFDKENLPGTIDMLEGALSALKTGRVNR